MIDLHSHTYQSDGTCSPEELVNEALAAGIDTLGITDHDTFAGYDAALPCARQAGLELLCGIELSTKLNGQSVHLLGYFFENADLAPLRAHIAELQASRSDRNRRLAERLQQLGLDVTLEEAQARGRGMTGRPHFAQILVQKGYAQSVQKAFDEFLGEDCKGYVERREPQFQEGVEWIRAARGIASIAHPVRLRQNLRDVIAELCSNGMNGIEAYHSDHSAHDIETFLNVAKCYGLAVTGGSDYHGTVKPGIRLGVGRGSLCVPDELIPRMREAAV